MVRRTEGTGVAVGAGVLETTGLAVGRVDGEAVEGTSLAGTGPPTPWPHDADTIAKATTTLPVRAFMTNLQCCRR